MRRIARQAFEIAVLPTIALGVALAVAPSRAALSFHVWLLVVAAIALLALARAVNRAVPATPSLFEVGGEPEDERHEAFPSLERLERSVSMATASGYDVHHRLAPPVREIASGLLLVRRGIDLDRQPDAARAVLGDDAWNLARAERERPQSRREPGLDEAQIELVVASLERI